MPDWVAKSSQNVLKNSPKITIWPKKPNLATLSLLIKMAKKYFVSANLTKNSSQKIDVNMRIRVRKRHDLREEEKILIMQI